ncbi:cytochrome b/b6 domain-containing protein [Streptomyces mirabilis]|uniref:cytochrome b/b6 domain-containing protein n=1 Tax=Streptomyces mirabilis TaxID=68239 RepID=UPI00368BC4CD
MTSTAGSPEPTREAAHPRSEPPGRIHRFGRAQRLAHRATSWLMLHCVATAACLYFPPLSELVGRRHLLVTVHEWTGILLPVPFLLGLTSSEFRRDLRKINRFADYDWRWLRAVRKRRTSPRSRPAGKFNAGQKLYAGWIAGAVPVMMITGLLMWFTNLLPPIPRTNAIFVHDWVALTIGLVVVGHMRLAYRDPEARRGMRTGYVDLAWAARHHPKWVGRD